MERLVFQVMSAQFSANIESMPASVSSSFGKTWWSRGARRSPRR